MQLLIQMPMTSFSLSDINMNASIPTPPREKACSQKRGKRQKQQARRKKLAIVIRMQFLNDIIKSRHGFKTAQKFHKFRVFLIKTLNLLNF